MIHARILGSRYENVFTYGGSVYTQHDNMNRYFNKKTYACLFLCHNLFPIH